MVAKISLPLLSSKGGTAVGRKYSIVFTPRSSMEEFLDNIMGLQEGTMRLKALQISLSFPITQKAASPTNNPLCYQQHSHCPSVSVVDELRAAVDVHEVERVRVILHPAGDGWPVVLEEADEGRVAHVHVEVRPVPRQTHCGRMGRRKMTFNSFLKDVVSFGLFICYTLLVKDVAFIAACFICNSPLVF